MRPPDGVFGSREPNLQINRTLAPVHGFRQPFLNFAFYCQFGKPTETAPLPTIKVTDVVRRSKSCAYSQDSEIWIRRQRYMPFFNGARKVPRLCQVNKMFRLS